MADSATERADWAELVRSGQVAQFAILCLGIWLHAADSLLVATAMPKAVAEIGGGHLVSWTLSLYLLGSILSGAAAALTASAFGLRRAFVAAAATYAAGCAVSALAPDMIAMLAGRFVQGIGGGLLVALTYVAIQRLFAEAMWPRLIGVMSAVWGASAFCGPLIGGFFADLGLWRWGFWAFAAQALALCVLVPLLMRPGAPAAVAPPGRVPLVRLAILSLAMLAVAGAGVVVAPATSLPMLTLAALAFAWFLRRDAARGAERMFPSGAFDMRTTLGAGFLANLALGTAAMSFTVYGPFLLAALHGVSALGAGYMIAAESVGWSTMAVVFAGASPQVERWLIRLGAATVTGAILALGLVMPVGPLWLIVMLAAAKGGGFGALWGFVVRRTIAAAPAAERDCASSAMPTTQQIAFTLGASLAGIVANAAGFAEGIDPAAAAGVAFWVFAAFVPVGLVGTAAAWRVSAR